MAHYFPYDVKLRKLAHSRSFLANQKARNAIFGAENLLISIIPILDVIVLTMKTKFTIPILQGALQLKKKTQIKRKRN